jgi:hypothetical protein
VGRGTDNRKSGRTLVAEFLDLAFAGELMDPIRDWRDIPSQRTAQCTGDWLGSRPKEA